MKLSSRFWRRLVIFGIASAVMAVFGTSVTFAQDADPMEAIASVQVAIDSTWILVASFLVFFMQAGFALLESGMIRQTGVVNSLMENFMDACIGGLTFFAVGYAVAFGASSGGLFGTTNFFLSEAMTFTDGGVDYGAGVSSFVIFFFQYAFAATAGTIATGAMAERTNFWGKIIYTIVVAALIYPVVVHWVWSAEGWLFNANFKDFAGSTVVHFVGGVVGLVGAIMLGARKGRVFGKAVKPHNLALATTGAILLWFCWYGFNAGSSLGMSNNGFVGLVAVNTTLAAAAGAVVAVMVSYFRTGKWDLPFALNGSLAGLVGITAGCAFVTPVSSIIIGGMAGILVIVGFELLERLKIDDAVGAFPVHGICGAFGTIAIGFLGQPELGANGLLFGGGFEQLGIQLVGVGAVAAWVSVTSVVMFSVVKALGVLRIPAKAEEYGIDIYEHGMTVWPDILPNPEDVAVETGVRGTAPAVGD